jgi:hypothetical protein
MVEIWKDIEGYENKYQVSNFGKIKSLSFNKTGLPKNLTPKIAGKGYRTVILSKKCIQTDFYIHRLLANHFIPNPENKKEVNHKDGDKTNNYVSNLEWNTHSENGIHSFRELGRIHPDCKGENNPKCKLNEIIVNNLRTDFLNGKPQYVMCKEYGINKSTMSNIISRKTWTHLP